jgi:hypothetical protein
MGMEPFSSGDGPEYQHHHHHHHHHQVFISVKDQALEVTTRGLDPYSPTRDEKGKNTHADK